MAISIDRVYQTVLAIANKEQNGYITPQEFNLFANRAQLEIFEQYFYDMEQFNRVHGITHDYADTLTNLEEKIEYFKQNNYGISIGNSPWGTAKLPDNLYRLGSARASNWFPAEELTRGTQQLLYNRHPLTRGDLNNPYFVKKTTATGTYIQFYPYAAAPANTEIHINYIRKPNTPKWAYVVVNNEALYNSNDSMDFEMHPSEETELVTKILFLAGITLDNPGLSQVAKSEEITKIQQEKQ